MQTPKIRLSFWQIWNMNVGFFGIQFSFGLQQTAINPIFSFLGADHAELPLLNLAGPVTGLIIQPIIGAISDKTWIPKWGRRKPFFMIGAIIASLCLFAFPYSSELWFAVGLLWILDVGNNTAMEPYRAFVGDKLPDEQLTYGFQMQSLFVGAGITLANFSIFLFQDWFSASGAPSSVCAAGTETVSNIPPWVYYSFFLGAVASLGTVLWSIIKTPEIPPSEDQLAQLQISKSKPFLAKILEPFIEIIEAIGDMPRLLKRLSIVYLFQWYALFIYWQFITPMLRRSLYSISNADVAKLESIKEACLSGASVIPADLGFAENIQMLSEKALAQTGLMNGTYNLVTMVVALALVPFAARFGNKFVYVSSLFLTGFAMLALPLIHNEWLLLLPMILLGIGWATMMGVPYSMVSKVIPQERRGVYMGIVNMMIVIPMFIQTLSFGPIIKYLLFDNPINAIIFAGVFFMIAGLLALRLNEKPEAGLK
ncbi:MAG: MFS transporter [Cyclobacteriaceae bacterium]